LPFVMYIISTSDKNEKRIGQFVFDNMLLLMCGFT